MFRQSCQNQEIKEGGKGAFVVVETKPTLKLPHVAFEKETINTAKEDKLNLPQHISHAKKDGFWML